MAVEGDGPGARLRGPVKENTGLLLIAVFPLADNGAFVHYGVVIDDHARIDADSFLMKGEHVPAHPVARQSGSGADHRYRRRGYP